jgi:hypothetical protein
MSPKPTKTTKAPRAKKAKTAQAGETPVEQASEAKHRIHSFRAIAMAEVLVVCLNRANFAPEEKRPGVAVWSPGQEHHRRASTRLSLVGLRPRNPDSVSPRNQEQQADAASLQNVSKVSARLLPGRSGRIGLAFRTPQTFA